MFANVGPSDFANDVKKITLDDNMIMASFDVESLFTNIPVRETIDICISYVFSSGKEALTQISKALFKTMLETAVLNSYFLLTGSSINRLMVLAWACH